jgi:energy-coupling factor transporter ATP-binding protein EcfA2
MSARLKKKSAKPAAEPSPPPDLLAEWVATAGLGEEVRDALVTWLAKQLVSDQFAKLEQGGHQEGGVALRKVFVDLPIAAHPGTESPNVRRLFLATLFAGKPVALCEVGAPEDYVDVDLGLSARPWEQKRHGFVVIGGPGQGKSTVGQLACQIHRAALLAPYLERLLPPQRDVARSFLDPQTRQDIGWPQEVLFPVRIELPRAAAWLSQQAATESAAPALLRWLAEQAKSRSVDISPEALGKLLSHAPFLLILDGFDEVGAVEDRNRITSSVRDLLGVLGKDFGRGIVVATSRPQGYAGELGSMGVPLATVNLVPLTVEEAIAYAGKLALAKYPNQPDERDRILAGLRKATEEEATARLLTTPLQVTIMAALAQRKGQPPSERWALFEEYFRTIYDREQERGTYAAPLLREYRMQIGRIHARAGLLLQVESEQAGGTDARLPRERLEEIADAVLREDEVEEEKRRSVVRRIVRAAEERLVFLVEPEPGRFGFEIRSLQEFMAAWALGEGDAEAVKARLFHVAKAPMFRAVVLFLASKFFTEGSHLRDVLADPMCRSLDEDTGDAAAREVKAGAALALEILEEGSVDKQPRYAKQLMRRACGLLDLPPCKEQARLGRIRAEGASEVLRAEVEARLGGERAFGAWVAMIEAAGLGAAWADKVGRAAWTVLDDASEIMRACGRLGVLFSHWLSVRIEDRKEIVEPTSLWHFSRASAGVGAPLAMVLLSGTYTSLGRHSHEAAKRWAPLAECQDAPERWRPWVSVARYVMSPSAAALAATLRELARPAGWEQRKDLSNKIPWPLHASLRSADRAEDLVSYAEAAETGLLGDIDDWKTAEPHWRVPVGEATHLRAHRALPWRREALAFLPPGMFLAPASSLVDWTAYLAVLRDAETIPSARLRQYIACVLMQRTRHIPLVRLPSLPWATIQRWARDASVLNLSLLRPRGPEGADGGEWLDGLDRLGRHRDIHLTRTQPQFVASWLVTAFCQHPGRLGLLRLILLFAEGGEYHNLPTGDRARLLDAIASLAPGEVAVHADAALLLIALDAAGTSDVDRILDAVGALAGSEPGLWFRLLELVDEGPLAEPVRAALLFALCQRADVPRTERAHALLALRGTLRSRRTGLSIPATWEGLGLPLPRPVARPSVLPSPFTLTETPAVLSQIKLDHIRGITDLTLDISPPPAPDQGQWAVLLGPNGAGKTTILRALTLALRNVSDAKIWPQRAFTPDWSPAGAPAGKSTIAVSLPAGQTFTTTFTRNGSESRSGTAKDTPFPLFAYGCRRGSALGGVMRDVNLLEDGGPEIATLFDEGASLVHAETWLLRWDRDAAREGGAKADTYEAILAALRKLLDVDEVVLRDQIYVSGQHVGKDIPLAGLSDGYLTTTGWFLDVVARWIDLATKHKLPIGADVMSRMVGLVLLDEIDLHLHPQWQIEVITRVKNLLPRMSFIVTTHNPLTLVGARPEEIWMLTKEDGVVRAERGVEAPMLLTGGQIYSRYFGIRDLYPSKIGEALRRYGFLSGYPLRNDDEQAEMEELRALLEGSGIEPGWEEVPREEPAPVRKEAASPRARKPKAPRGAKP